MSELKQLVNGFNSRVKVKAMARFPFAIYRQNIKYKVLMKNIMNNNDYVSDFSRAIELLLNYK